MSGERYTIDLDARGIEMVDVEIRGIVKALRDLPCVERTMFSCAGYGRAGLAQRNPLDHPADDPTGHFPTGNGYVMVEYRDRSWMAELHKDLLEVFDYAREERHARVVSYCLHFGTGNDRLPLSAHDADAYLERRWAEVAVVIRKHQQKEST